MQQPKKKTPKTIADKIRKLLFNYDLAITWAEEELAYQTQQKKLFANRNSKYARSRFIASKVAIERAEIFLEETKKRKNEIVSKIQKIVGRYSDEINSKVFVLYYIQKHSVEKIAKELSMSIFVVSQIISMFNEDLVIFFDI